MVYQVNQGLDTSEKFLIVYTDSESAKAFDKVNQGDLKIVQLWSLRCVA